MKSRLRDKGDKHQWQNCRTESVIDFSGSNLMPRLRRSHFWWSFFNPWPPLCADHGLRIWRTSGAQVIVAAIG